MYPHNISTQSLANSCDFGLTLATISQQPNDTDVQFAGRKSKTVPRRPWDERWCFFIFSSLCHTEKRNRAQERDAVLLQELQEKELLDVMNLAVHEAALPLSHRFYGPFVLEEMSRVVSTLFCVFVSNETDRALPWFSSEQEIEKKEQQKVLEQSRPEVMLEAKRSKKWIQTKSCEP